eukprot:357281-Chlamydomonas_euryale.AAC.24
MLQQQQQDWQELRPWATWPRPLHWLLVAARYCWPPVLQAALHCQHQQHPCLPLPLLAVVAASQPLLLARHVGAWHVAAWLQPPHAAALLTPAGLSEPAAALSGALPGGSLQVQPAAESGAHQVPVAPRPS